MLDKCGKYSMYRKRGPTDTMEKFTSTVVYISSDWSNFSKCLLQ